MLLSPRHCSPANPRLRLPGHPDAECREAGAGEAGAAGPPQQPWQAHNAPVSHGSGVCWLKPLGRAAARPIAFECTFQPAAGRPRIGAPACAAILFAAVHPVILPACKLDMDCLEYSKACCLHAPCGERHDWVLAAAGAAQHLRLLMGKLTQSPAIAYYDTFGSAGAPQQPSMRR